MSKLNIDQKNIKSLFQDKKADFLIPDYQRPYAWGEDECKTLWDDIFSFAFPEDDYSKFDEYNDEYFLGPIVTFKNDSGKMEVIDGQQRLTTIMLLLRAFYARMGNMMDANSVSMRKDIEQCIWKTDMFGNFNMQSLKIDSEVASDDDKEDFLGILRTGKIPNSENGKKHKSKYAANYALFQMWIEKFLQSFPSYFPYLPARILNNCVLLPIEAESQDTALRIFSTLNDRGKPLSDADIFKAQFYKYYSKLGKKNYFIAEWKNLEEICNNIFHPITGTPMDDLFTRYMYYERSLQDIKSSTTEALRKFYEKDNYKLLHNERTFENLIKLAHFWADVSKQDSERFSNDVLRRLFVLNYAPNGMWAYLVSVYYMNNRLEDDSLDNDRFLSFLEKITAFIWAYGITNPGVNALRTPIFAEMVNIVKGRDVEFADYKFDAKKFESIFDNYEFTNIRPITKSVLAWWAFNNINQPLLDIDTRLDIEHIYARNRQKNESGLKNAANLEILGNKALLESRINIRASDYRFVDKKKYYIGYKNSKGDNKKPTQITELVDIAYALSDFTESDICKRNEQIKKSFVEFLNINNLLY